MMREAEVIEFCEQECLNLIGVEAFKDD